MSLLNACTRFRQTFAVWAHPLYKDHKQINYLNLKRARALQKGSPENAIWCTRVVCLWLPFTLLYDRKTLRPFVVGRLMVLTHNRIYTYVVG